MNLEDSLFILLFMASSYWYFFSTLYKMMFWEKSTAYKMSSYTLRAGSHQVDTVRMGTFEADRENKTIASFYLEADYDETEIEVLIHPTKDKGIERHSELRNLVLLPVSALLAFATTIGFWSEAKPLAHIHNKTGFMSSFTYKKGKCLIQEGIKYDEIPCLDRETCWEKGKKHSVSFNARNNSYKKHYQSIRFYKKGCGLFADTNACEKLAWIYSSLRYRNASASYIRRLCDCGPSKFCIIYNRLKDGKSRLKENALNSKIIKKDIEK